MKKAFFNGTIVLVIMAIIGAFVLAINSSFFSLAPPALLMNPIYGCQDINFSGSYLLQNNINVTSFPATSTGACLNLNVNNIDLNLNGYTITGAGLAVTPGAILSKANRSKIRNGIIENFGTGIYLVTSNFNTVENNVIKNTNDEGIFVLLGSNNTIKNNRIIDSQMYGLYIRDTSFNQISNNLIKNSSAYDFYMQVSSPSYCNNMLLNNSGSNGMPILLLNNNSIISNVKLSELVLCNADGSKINRVMIDNSGFSNNGILTMETDNIIIKGISVTNSLHGIFMLHGLNNTLSDSTFNYNTQGMWISEISNSNKIIRSSINGNHFGLLIYGSSNDIHSNYITGNLEGISIGGGNLIYNNLFNNSNNIGPIGDDFNSWNTTLTLQRNIVGGPYIGGNFWADYNGTGFSETCTDANNNRICDQQYNLWIINSTSWNVNNTDYLALK